MKNEKLLSGEDTKGYYIKRNMVKWAEPYKYSIIIYIKHYIINGYNHYSYSIDDSTWYDSIPELLKSTYNTQGNFYENFCKVTNTEAKYMEWDPDSNRFSDENPGWKKFIKDKGLINKNVIVSDWGYRIEEILFET